MDNIRDLAQDMANDIMSIPEDHPNYETAYDHAWQIAVEDIIKEIHTQFGIE
jgi:hypothetical protein